MSQRFSLYPYQASYNNWLVSWDAGYAAGSGVPSSSPGQLGTVNPIVVNGFVTNDSVSLKRYLNLPTNLPFNTSRQLYISTTGSGWDDYQITLVYQNYWGVFLTDFITLPDGSTPTTLDVLLGTMSQAIFVTADTTFAACQKFFYPNRLIDIIITAIGVAPTTPTQPFYLDFGAQGMAEFNIQESVNYGSKNFTLEVLTDGDNNTPVKTTQYCVLNSNYPRFVYDNQMSSRPGGPLVLSDVFIPYGSVDNTFEFNSTINRGIFWCATEDFPITTVLLENSYTDLSQLGGPLNVLVDIGNQRRNAGWTDVAPGVANESNLLISLIQNGLTS